MPLIKFIKPYKFAHQGIHVEEFQPSDEPVETTDECAAQAIEDKVAKPVKAKPEKPADPTRQELDTALAALPGENTDPEYVVRAMRAHFGALFTDADEATVRAAVKAPE